MWTKLRPGIHDFMRSVATRFELYVYTMGAKRYAEAMRSHLDLDPNLDPKLGPKLDPKPGP